MFSHSIIRKGRLIAQGNQAIGCVLQDGVARPNHTTCKTKEIATRRILTAKATGLCMENLYPTLLDSDRRWYLHDGILLILGTHLLRT